MRVGIVTQLFPPDIGGSIKVMQHLAGSFDPADTVVITRQDGVAGVDHLFPFRVARVDMGQSLSIRWFRPRSLPIYWKTTLSALHVVRQQRLDFLIAGQVLPAGVAALLAKQLFGTRCGVVVYGEDLHGYKGTTFKKTLAGLVLRNADLVVAISEFSKRLALSFGASPDRLAVIMPGVEVERFQAVAPAGLKERLGLSGKKIVLSVGRFVRRKGFDSIIRSLPQVLERCPEAVYVIVGNAPNPDNKVYRDELIELAESLGLHGRVKIFENVVDDDLPLYYSICDVFAMPNRTLSGSSGVEGFGIVFLEAGACGKPVIGGRSGGAREAVLEGETGFLVEPDDVPALAGRLTLLLGNPELARRMGERGRAYVLEHHTWARAQGILRRAVEDLVHSSAVRSGVDRRETEGTRGRRGRESD